MFSKKQEAQAAEKTQNKKSKSKNSATPPEPEKSLHTLVLLDDCHVLTDESFWDTGIGRICRETKIPIVLTSNDAIPTNFSDFDYFETLVLNGWLFHLDFHAKTTDFRFSQNMEKFYDSEDEEDQISLAEISSLAHDFKSFLQKTVSTNLIQDQILAKTSPIFGPSVKILDLDLVRTDLNQKDEKKSQKDQDSASSSSNLASNFFNSNSNSCSLSNSGLSVSPSFFSNKFHLYKKNSANFEENEIDVRKFENVHHFRNFEAKFTEAAQASRLQNSTPPKFFLQNLKFLKTLYFKAEDLINFNLNFTYLPTWLIFYQKLIGKIKFLETNMTAAERALQNKHEEILLGISRRNSSRSCNKKDYLKMHFSSNESMVKFYDLMLKNYEDKIS